jgi:hypothetical protein
MHKHRKFLAALLVITFPFVAVWGYYRWRSRDPVAVRAEMLSHLPADASAVVFLDLAQFRSSPFLAQFFAWAPHPAPDEDYAQFVRVTGFNYERDLDRLAVAISRQSKISTMLLVADGRFDHKKIAAYAARFGKPQIRGGQMVYSFAPAGSQHPSFFSFLREDRIAWTDDPSYAALFEQTRTAASVEWTERFERLAGTPLFALLRPESGSASTLAQQAPGGFRSPQLAALLDQLQWISIGARPEGNLLRVVVEGECFSETTMRQLSDFLGGILILTQNGLNDPQTRKKLDPQLREACLGLLHSADVQKIDRGTSKSVRLIFDVTPALLQTARAVAPQLATPHP